jgi:hypothetical protein
VTGFCFTPERFVAILRFLRLLSRLALRLLLSAVWFRVEALVVTMLPWWDQGCREMEHPQDASKTVHASIPGRWNGNSDDLGLTSIVNMG